MSGFGETTCGNLDLFTDYKSGVTRAKCESIQTEVGNICYIYDWYVKNCSLTDTRSIDKCSYNPFPSRSFSEPCGSNAYVPYQKSGIKVDIPTRGRTPCFNIPYLQFDAETCSLVREIVFDPCCVSVDTPMCYVCADDYGESYGYVSQDESWMFLAWIGIHGFAYQVCYLYST